MFKQLLLAGSLVVSGVALHAPAASAAPLRAPVELDIGSAIQPVQYYYGPRRYVPPRYYVPPPYYRRRYYGRPYYAPRPYHAPRPYYGVRPYPYYGAPYRW